MIIRGKWYDAIKAAGKWVLPVLIMLLPIVQDFVRVGNYSTVAVIGFAIILLNAIQAISKKNYKAEQED